MTTVRIPPSACYACSGHSDNSARDERFSPTGTPSELKRVEGPPNEAMTKVKAAIEIHFRNLNKLLLLANYFWYD